MGDGTVGISLAHSPFREGASPGGALALVGNLEVEAPYRQRPSPRAPCPMLRVQGLGINLAKPYSQDSPPTQLCRARRSVAMWV